jgi:hypothetical protein
MDTPIGESAGRLLRVLSASLTPSTLAAMIKDLDENDGLTECDAALLDVARERLERQLVCMMGDDEAESMCRPEPRLSVAAAARALLEAREDQMVTQVEWDRLRNAVAAEGKA